MVTSVQTVRWLAWTLVALAIGSAVVTLLTALGILYPSEEIADLVQRIEAFRANDVSAFPILFLGSLATLGVFIIGAVLGVALRGWARVTGLRDAMTLLFVIGGTIGIAANLLNIGVSQAATFGYCDCGYKAEELIAQDYALGLGFSLVNWLQIGAVTLVGMGAAVAGRIIEISPAWRMVSYGIAAVLLLAVALRVLAAFVFLQAFDPVRISDLLIALAAGILVPIWAILLARGLDDGAPDAALQPAAAS
jgi:hypothetical protein